MSTPKPELISFKLCPFVQRSVITLREKGADFDITYIDLANPPDWFLKISPLGKVPVLRVGDTAVFESAVINEYLDETNPPSLHPADPLRRAHNRAWIEFGSAILVDTYFMSVAKDKDGCEQKANEVRAKLKQVEGQLGDGPYFNGAHFSLVDTAYAPLFMRLALTDHAPGLGLVAENPKVKAWSEALLSRESVKNSVVPEFHELAIADLKKQGAYLAEFL